MSHEQSEEHGPQIGSPADHADDILAGGSGSESGGDSFPQTDNSLINGTESSNNNKSTNNNNNSNDDIKNNDNENVNGNIQQNGNINENDANSQNQNSNSKNDSKKNNNNNNNNLGNSNDTDEKSPSSSSKNRLKGKRGPSSTVLSNQDEYDNQILAKANAKTQAIAQKFTDKNKNSNDTNNNNNNSNTNPQNASDNNDSQNSDPNNNNDDSQNAQNVQKQNNNNNDSTNQQATKDVSKDGSKDKDVSKDKDTQQPQITKQSSLNNNSLYPDLDRIIQKLMTMTMRRSKRSKYITATQTDPNNMLTEKELESVCQRSRKIFMSQPMLIEVDAPIKIVGDIHGQYFDLLRLFELGGMPPEANYIFLGDYVDRGRNSLEVISLLLSFKIKYPNNFFLLRGNHECASINRIYGFFDECKRRYKSGVRLWKQFCDVFNCLPVAAIIDDKIFCQHGGLSPDLRNFEQIRRIRRPTDVPDSGLLCDLLWADPDKEQIGWGENDRGVSYTFGPDILAKFLRKHDMDLVCRAHQVVEDGYEFFGQRRLVTIFSAPNYCGEFDNAGAMMSVDDTLMCSFHILKPAFSTKNTRFYG